MSKKISLSVFIFTLLAAILLTFLSTFVIVSRVYDDELRDAYLDEENEDQPSGPQTAGKFSKLELLDLIFQTYSYFDIDDEEVIENVLKAYAMSTGDRYAEYYTEEEFKAMTSESAGEMQGIGINVIFNTEYGCIEIINVMPDSPALAGGVMPGDLIAYVGIGDNRQSVQNLGYTKAVKQLQGLAGTSAEFVVFRGENYSEEIEFSIKRGYVTTQSVMSRVCETDKSVGIIKVIQFDLTTPTQFCEAVDNLKSQGIEKFVFDVRYNPGGDLNSIVAVLSYFLNENDVIISSVDNENKKHERRAVPASYLGDYASCNITKSDIGKYRDLNCVVLANDNTASAAELFTSNFRDYKLAPIVGVKTYGKGSMQSILSLERFGYKGAVKLTTQMYFPPCGEGYDGIGITPDIEVELSEEAKKVNIYKLSDADDNQLQRAIQELK